MNLPPFYIGQKVICIDNVSPYGNTYLQLNKEYIIRDLKKFSCCNQWVVDVGNVNKALNTFCMCGAKNSSIDGNYKLAFRFKSLEQLKFPLMKYSKIIEKELVSAN